MCIYVYNLKEASIFQAELAAIKHAAKFVHENYDKKIKFIKIFSDSQAALKALQKPNTTMTMGYGKCV